MKNIQSMEDNLPADQMATIASMLVSLLKKVKLHNRDNLPDSVCAEEQRHQTILSKDMKSEILEKMKCNPESEGS